MTSTNRCLWLSDLHLGMPACRADDLLGFLSGVQADRIFLTGDIVDIESLRSRPLFPVSHWEVLQRFAQLATNGTEVIYVPGNHDRELRQLAGSLICGIRIALEAWHTTAAGQRLLVIHGDCLDAQIRKGTGLERFGAAAYGWLVRADASINSLRSKLGKDYSSIATRIKMRIRSANEYIHHFEHCAADYAASRGADGVVCGHIHRPALKPIGGVLYANDGDWVEHRTAIVENAAGKLQLLSWQDGAPQTVEMSNGRALVAA